MYIGLFWDQHFSFDTFVYPRKCAAADFLRSHVLFIDLSDALVGSLNL